MIVFNLNMSICRLSKLLLLGPYLSTILKNILCLFLQDLVTLNEAQLPIG